MTELARIVETKIPLYLQPLWRNYREEILNSEIFAVVNALLLDSAQRQGESPEEHFLSGNFTKNYLSMIGLNAGSESKLRVNMCPECGFIEYEVQHAKLSGEGN